MVLVIITWCRGGSRIPRRRGANPPGGVPTYDFAKFHEKLHEIEKILGHWVRPTKSTTVVASDVNDVPNGRN